MRYVIFGRCPDRRIDVEQAARHQPPLARLQLANIHDLRPDERHAVERRLDPRVRIVAADVDEDPPDAPPLAFLDVVDQVDLARLFEEHGLRLHVGEH